MFTASEAARRLSISLVVMALGGLPVVAQRIDETCMAGRLPLPEIRPISSSPLLAPEVRVLYFLPTDRPWSQSREDLILQASQDAHAWYADHTDNGRTFLWSGAIERVFGLQSSSYYNVDLWGRVQTELGSRGYPVWQPRTVLMVWVDGAGLWAGGATWYDWSGLAMLSAEAFIELGCVPTHPSNWPCTPAGAMAHELGHTFGMPHPDAAGDWLGVFLNDHSLMGAHWNFPERAPRDYIPTSPWGLLNYERDHLRYNPVLGQDGSPFGPIPGDPMEMPALPDPPLQLSVKDTGTFKTRLQWSDDGAFDYDVYWSTTPGFATYSKVTGSPTSAFTLTHTDSGETLLFFQVFEIPLSD